MIVAGILTIAIFPASISQSIGGGYRGVDTLDNLTDLSVEGIWYRLKSCYKLLNQHLFGNCFPILLVITIVGVIFWIISDRKITHPDLQDKEGEKWAGWILAVVPSVLYFLSISKIAVYITERYFHPIYALLMILGVALPLSLLRHVKAYRLLVLCFVLYYWEVHCFIGKTTGIICTAVPEPFYRQLRSTVTRTRYVFLNMLLNFRLFSARHKTIKA